MIKLNLGSGNAKKDGFINLDNSNQYHPDLICDLNNRIPFNDEAVSEIHASHVLEHLDPNKIDQIISDWWRVCHGCASITIIVPINKAWLSWPQHRVPFSEHSWKYFEIFHNKGIRLFNILHHETVITDDGLGDELHIILEVVK